MIMKLCKKNFKPSQLFDKQIQDLFHGVLLCGEMKKTKGDTGAVFHNWYLQERTATTSAPEEFKDTRPDEAPRERVNPPDNDEDIDLDGDDPFDEDF